MKTTPRRAPLHRPWVVWLAVLIAVLAALVPTVSQALAAGQTPQGVEICTSAGPRLVDADVAASAASADDSAPTPASVVSPGHCQFCLQTTDRVVLINDPLPHPFLVQDGQRKPPVWQAFFYATTHTVNPPPRGPPGFF